MLKDRPKLSIITVCYNEQERIEMTCDSIIAQTFQDFEWIVLDGGSTDGTLEVLSRYRDHMAYFRSGPDGGIYAAMNEGIEKARGEYCLFLNGGDRFHGAGTLNESISYLTHDPQIGVGGIVVIDGDRENLHLRNSWKPLYMHFWAPPQPATFYRRAVFKEIGDFDTSFKVAADIEFYFRAVYSGILLSVIPVVVTDFYRDGISSRSKKIIREEMRRIRSLYCIPGTHLVVEWVLIPLKNMAGKIKQFIKSTLSIFLK